MGNPVSGLNVIYASANSPNIVRRLIHAGDVSTADDAYHKLIAALARQIEHARIKVATSCVYAAIWRNQAERRAPNTVCQPLAEPMISSRKSSMLNDEKSA